MEWTRVCNDRLVPRARNVHCLVSLVSDGPWGHIEPVTFLVVGV